MVGRESNVRGVPFQNGSILAALATGLGFTLPFRQERKFTTRFGRLIYEDILHLIPKEGEVAVDHSFCRHIGRVALEVAIGNTKDRTVLSDMENAIERADSVPASPLYDRKESRPK